MPWKSMVCFRLLLEYLAWIKHQFLSDIRDSRKAGSLWGMMRGVGGVKSQNTRVDWPKKNFMDKYRRVSIETISAQFDVSVGTVHTIIREELKMRKICAKFVPRVLREDQKERRCHDSREMVELINWDPAVLDALMTWDESWIYCYDPETKRQSSQWKHAGSPRPLNAWQSKSTHKPLMVPFFFDSTKTVHQSTTPSLSQTIWPRWTSRVPQPPYSPDLAPCDFWLFTKLRGCRYETNEEMKEAVTKVIDTLTQEDFHGAFQKLLERYNKCIATGGDSFEGE